MHQVQRALAETQRHAAAHLRVMLVVVALLCTEPLAGSADGQSCQLLAGESVWAGRLGALAGQQLAGWLAGYLKCPDAYVRLCLLIC